MDNRIFVPVVGIRKLDIHVYPAEQNKVRNARQWVRK